MSNVSLQTRLVLSGDNVIKKHSVWCRVKGRLAFKASAPAAPANTSETAPIKQKRPSVLKKFLRRASVLSVLSTVGRAFGSFGGKTPEAAAEVETSEELAPPPPTSVAPLLPATQALLCPPTTPEQQLEMEAVLVSTFLAVSASGCSPRLVALPVDPVTSGLIKEVLAGARAAGPMFNENYRALFCFVRGPGMFSVVCAPLVPLRPFAVCSCIIKKKDADGNWDLGHKQLVYSKVRAFLQNKWANQLWFRWLHEDADLVYMVSDISVKQKKGLLKYEKAKIFDLL
ncbi:hypothetical protein MP638_006220 [Amoeboaphelidium occidentale]|nr:hypothetical protein MP638_006220 [Amoeboaphelidium occidentale]